VFKRWRVGKFYSASLTAAYGILSNLRKEFKKISVDSTLRNHDFRHYGIKDLTTCAIALAIRVNRRVNRKSKGAEDPYRLGLKKSGLGGETVRWFLMTSHLLAICGRLSRSTCDEATKKNIIKYVVAIFDPMR